MSGGIGGPEKTSFLRGLVAAKSTGSWHRLPEGTCRFCTPGTRSGSSRPAWHPCFIAKTTKIASATYLHMKSMSGKRRRNEDPSKFMNKILGIVLIVIGIAGLAWGGFSYTTREKVVDIGPIHASRDKNHSVPLPPIAGAIALIGGVALVVVGKNN